MSTVTIGCSLPHGLVLRCDAAPYRVTLRGGVHQPGMAPLSANKMAQHGVGTTADVPAAFWAAWSRTAAGVAYLASGVVYELSPLAAA